MQESKTQTVIHNLGEIMGTILTFYFIACKNAPVLLRWYTRIGKGTLSRINIKICWFHCVSLNELVNCISVLKCMIDWHIDAPDMSVLLPPESKKTCSAFHEIKTILDWRECQFKVHYFPVVSGKIFLHIEHLGAVLQPGISR